MKNNSILKIKNKKLVLEAGVENLDSKKLTNIFTKPAAALFSTAANVIGDALNLSVFVISSILTMFAPDEVKNSIKNNYKKRRRKIFDKYQSIMRDFDLSGGAEESLFLVSPSLYLIDKASDDFKESGGIIGENISEFLDDPQNYILGLIPQLKGFSKEKKEEKVDNTNLKIILKKLKDFGIKNLEELTKKENSNLKYNERQALKGIIKLYKENKNLLENSLRTLKINKEIIFENEENKIEIKQIMQEYQKEIDNLTLKSFEFILEEKDFKEEFEQMSNENKKYILNCQGAVEMSSFIAKLLTEIKSIIDSNDAKNIKNLSKFMQNNKINIEDEKIKKEYMSQFEDSFLKLFSSLENITDIRDLIKILIEINISDFIDKLINSLKKEISFLAEDSIKSFTELKSNLELKNTLVKIESDSKQIISNLESLINFYKQLKNDNKQ